MPLVHFTFKLEDVPAGAVNVQDITESYRGHFSNPDSKLYTWETHHGLCLEEYEQNGRDDSDFYMRVWNPEAGDVERILFYSTRGWMYPCRASHVDATPEVEAAYQALCHKQAEAARVRAAQIAEQQPGKGKTLKVVKGRKVPVGTVGRCFWASVQQKWFYTAFMGYQGRVGIETADGQRHFTNVDNVELVPAC